MAIKTSTFGSVTLTGEAARAFKRQFLSSKKAKPNKKAEASLKRGRRLLKEFLKKGYVEVNPS